MKVKKQNHVKEKTVHITPLIRVIVVSVNGILMEYGQNIKRIKEKIKLKI